MHVTVSSTVFLNCIYHIENIWRYHQLLNVLDHSHTITIHPRTSCGFFDWCKHLVKHYTELKGKIEQNHIFHCSADDVSTNAKGNKVIPYKIKEAEIIDAVICDIKCKKKEGKTPPTHLILNLSHPSLRILTKFLSFTTSGGR